MYRKRSDGYKQLAFDNLTAGDVYYDITDSIHKYPITSEIRKTVFKIADQIRQKTGWEIRILYYNNIQAEEEYWREVMTRPHFIIARVDTKEVSLGKLFGIFPRKSKIEKIKTALVEIDDEALPTLFGKLINFIIITDADVIFRIIKNEARKYAKKSDHSIDIVMQKL